MTPDRRLDQIEPLVAEVLQKVDRLVESNGKLLDLAVNTQANLADFKDEVRTNNEITARGIANLTVSTQRQFDELKAGFGGLKEDFAGLKASQEKQFDELKTGGETTAGTVTGLTVKFDELKAEFSELKTGQELILQLLRDKLS